MVFGGGGRPAGPDGMAGARRRAAPGAGNGTDREPNGDGDAPAPAAEAPSTKEALLAALAAKKPAPLDSLQSLPPPHQPLPPPHQLFRQVFYSV